MKKCLILLVLSLCMFMYSNAKLRNIGGIITSGYFAVNKSTIYYNTLCSQIQLGLLFSYYSQEKIDTVLPTYQELLDKYKGGNRKMNFLYTLAMMADKNKDAKNASIIASDYIKRIKNPFTQENMDFISKFTTSSKNPGFKYFLNNPRQVDSILGENRAASQIKFVIYKDEIEPFTKNKTVEPNWNHLEKDIVKKYGNYGEEIVWRAKMFYYHDKKDWTTFAECATPYIKKYGNDLPNYELNNFAWDVFKNISDKKILLEAISWSQKSFKDGMFCNFLDTHANLLYKVGETEKAIATEENAIKISPEGTKVEFQKTLEKMKEGKPTWEL